MKRTIMYTLAINIIHGFFIERVNLNKNDSLKLKYMIELFISESSKILIMFLIFYSFNNELAYIQSLITLVSLRLFTGGLHFEDYICCFIFSLFFFSISIISSNILGLTSSISLMIYVFAVVTVFTCSPA